MSTQGEPIKTVLVDDHLLFRQSLKAMVSHWNGIEIIGECGEGKEALNLVQKLKPQVVVLDITMTGLSGLDLAPLFIERVPDTRIVILSMHDDADLVHKTLEIGCKGYVIKSDPAEELERAIENVYKGKTYLSPSIATEYLTTLSREPITPKTSLLTPREEMVKRLIAQGRSTEEIAEDLFISVSTVRVHIANVMKKYSCQSRQELIARLNTKKHYIN